MSQSSTHMLCSTFVSAKIRHGNLKTSVFNFCGSMLPGFADFNAKNNKKNLHGVKVRPGIVKVRLVHLVQRFIHPFASHTYACVKRSECQTFGFR